MNSQPYGACEQQPVPETHNGKATVEKERKVDLNLKCLFFTAPFPTSLERSRDFECAADEIVGEKEERYKN